MLYDFKSQQWRQIKLDLGTSVLGYLSWSPDSSSVYFDTMLGENSGYYRVRIRDAKVEKVADFKRLRQFGGQFGTGSWTALAPGENLMLPRDISTQEIYAFDLQLP